MEFSITRVVDITKEPLLVSIPDSIWPESNTLTTRLRETPQDELKPIYNLHHVLFEPPQKDVGGLTASGRKEPSIWFFLRLFSFQTTQLNPMCLFSFWALIFGPFSFLGESLLKLLQFEEYSLLIWILNENVEIPFLESRSTDVFFALQGLFVLIFMDFYWTDRYYILLRYGVNLV